MLPLPLSRVLTRATEEEKKLLAQLLGKLYISPASTEEKIREVYAEVSAAVDGKVMSDATGRNALYKIHVSLGKIVNSLTEKAPRGRKASAPVEDRTMLLDDEEREEKPRMQDLEEEDENTIRPTPEADDMNETLRSSVEASIVEEEEDSSGRVKEEEEGEDTTILPKQEPEDSQLGRDSLVESLLSDDELEMSGM
jgi:condensin complex subunit 3